MKTLKELAKKSIVENDIPFFELPRTLAKEMVVSNIENGYSDKYEKY